MTEDAGWEERDRLKERRKSETIGLERERERGREPEEKAKRKRNVKNTENRREQVPLLREIFSADLALVAV